MWNPPEATLRSGTHYMSRQDILHQSCACWPEEVEPINTYLTKLINYREQLNYTNYAITDRDVRMQPFTSLPS
jgi:hypothetical protein